jgi:hypothetical protein
MTRRRTPFTLSELSGERVFRAQCLYYSAHPDLPVDPLFVRELMAFLLERFPKRRLTSEELALAVDQFTIPLGSATKARKRVAKLEGRTVEAVTRAHQRYGVPVNGLRARREKWLERARKPIAGLDAERDAERRELFVELATAVAACLAILHVA